MFSDNKMVLQLLSLLKQSNIRRVVVSPGSRHFAFVHSMEADSFFKLYSVVDERSAGFFALGLIQQTKEIVAVTCSSGTACMNYGSAIVEAFYQKLPLLVLSSDRVPYFLNQNEDQMYDQISTFAKCTKYHAQLPVVKDNQDEWYCNRLINEGIIALTHRGRGPVHINIPFLAHNTDTFSTLEIPIVRKINMNPLYMKEEEWNNRANKLKGKKIMILWGQSVPIDDILLAAVSRFTNNYDAIILTDKISNLHHVDSIDNTTVLLGSLSAEEACNLQPDIVISIGGNYIFNGEIKNYLSRGNAENWIVGPEGVVCDPFNKLSEVFDMDEYSFFEIIGNITNYSNEGNYRETWKCLSQLPSPSMSEFNELYVIGKLLNNIPLDSDLQLANSCTIRISHFFETRPDIRINCNRGVNGIDGSMSTAIGFGAENIRNTFYITGDLSFFYDMNSLWIRHLSRKMRILLINNGGGAIMYSPLNDEVRKTLSNHIAAGHNCSAKGWAESTGFQYLSATTDQEFDQAIKYLCSIDIEKPILVEVFTSIVLDVNTITSYLRSVKKNIPEIQVSWKSRIKGELKNVIKHTICRK